MDVLLLCWNDGNRVADCIQQLTLQLSPSDIIWVVDNGSEEPFTTEATNVQIIRNLENRGFAGGINTGLSKILETAAEYLFLLNTDVCLSPDLLKTLQGSLEGNPSVGLASPAIKETSTSSENTYWGSKNIAYHLRTRRLAKINASHEALYYSSFLSGTALLCRTSVFRDAGLLNEDYFFSGEIADLCERARSKGWELAVCTEVMVRHNLESSGEQREKIHSYYSLRNRFLFIRDHVPTGLKTMCRTAWILMAGLLITKAALCHKPSLQIVLKQAVKDGLHHTFGKNPDLTEPKFEPS